MTLQETAWIGGLVGAAAMVISVIFASIQIRNNTRAIRAAAFQQIAVATASSYQELARDAVLCSLVLRGNDDFDALDRVEKARYRFHQMAFLRHAEIAFVQERIGTLKGEYWVGIRGTMDSYFSSAGARDAWSLVRPRINAEFRSYVDEIVRIQTEEAATQNR
jgi:hypothetical protein